MLSIVDLTLSTTIAGRRVDLLRNFSISLARGKVLGLVGESGAGKSMIGRIIAGQIPGGFRVTRGRVIFDDVDLLALDRKRWRALLGRRIAFIPQEPLTALNPVLTIGQTFDEHLAHLGLAAGQRRAMMLRQFDAVHLPRPEEMLQRYPHELSGGQCQRVLIAMAFVANPALIVADEPTTALDVVSQLNILRLLAEQRRQHETAMLLITHDLRLAAHVCDDIAVLYAGEQVEYGPAREVLRQSAHPYTSALDQATPDVHGPQRRLAALSGQMPGVSALGMITGCRFAARCSRRTTSCEVEPPEPIETAPGHRVLCVWPLETSARETTPNNAAATASTGHPIRQAPSGRGSTAPLIELRE